MYHGIGGGVEIGYRLSEKPFFRPYIGCGGLLAEHIMKIPRAGLIKVTEGKESKEKHCLSLFVLCG